MKTIIVLTPCYNEETNVDAIYNAVKNAFSRLQNYEYRHLFIDNASTDNTAEKIKSIIHQDPNVQLIINARNFGHIRSPFHGILQAKGDAVILIAADLQEPPELILKFIEKWEQGYKIAVGIKNKSKESKMMFNLRKCYYRMLAKFSEAPLIENYTGFGLYDKSVVELLKKYQEPYPYFRGLISEMGIESAKIYYVQPLRQNGKSKNNFYTLYDNGMLGITSHSKVPLRIATICGFILSFISLCIALVYLVYKLLYWDAFVLGTAPILIGLFFFASVQLFFIGLLGEYVLQILIQVKNHPHVIEKERINF